MIIKRWIIKFQLSSIPQLDRSARNLILDDVLRYVNQSKKLSPWFVRGGLTVLETFFAVLLITAFFPSAESYRARKLVNIWNGFPQPAPNLIRFYSSLTVLKAFEHPLIRERLKIDDDRKRVLINQYKRNALMSSEK